MAKSGEKDNAPEWSKAANADIESAAAEEELNYKSANLKKLSPRVATAVVVFFVLYTVALYYLFSPR